MPYIQKKQMQLQHVCKHSSVDLQPKGNALVFSEIFSLNQFIRFGLNETLRMGTERCEEERNRLNSFGRHG